MLSLARNARKLRLKMFSPSKPPSKTRSMSVSSRDIAKKFLLDETAVVVEDSHWTYNPDNKKAKTLLTCEHASNRFPQHLKKEHELVDTHWAIDIGAEDVAGRLASDMHLPMLSSRISRLVVDVNRPTSSDTMFRTMAEGKPIALNANLTSEERQDRIDRYWRPYRFELKEILQTLENIDLVISVHSFTPLYEGEPRDCEVGVLYIDSKAEAHLFLEDLAAKGYKVVENEPWPAALCDIAVPIAAAGKKHVIFEIRNDLASNPEFRRRIAGDIRAVLEKAGLA